MKETKDQQQEQSFGKYILIDELKEKHKENFVSDAGLTISSILYLEGIHFSLVYFPLKHLGYKSVINSIADLYSKKVKPEVLIVNIGVSKRFKKNDIESIIEGISLACKRYNIKISSLDISSSLTGLAINIASYGKPVHKDKKTETGATDLICVSGDLGAAYMGLQLLERERHVFEESGGAQPKLEGFEYVIGRQLKPEIRNQIFEDLINSQVSTGIIRTIRDGLASEIMHIARESGTGCRIYHDKLPLDSETVLAGKELGVEPIIAALNGGDDFEFVFTIPVTDHEKIKEVQGVSVVGHLVPAEEGHSLVLQDGSLAELKAQGWADE